MRRRPSLGDSRFDHFDCAEGARRPACPAAGAARGVVQNGRLYPAARLQPQHVRATGGDAAPAPGAARGVDGREERASYGRHRSRTGGTRDFRSGCEKRPCLATRCPSRVRGCCHFIPEFSQELLRARLVHRWNATAAGNAFLIRTPRLHSGEVLVVPLTRMRRSHAEFDD
jgi:hypothetical protein